MGVKIIVDSTADLQPQQKARVRVVPLTVNFGQEEFVDGVTITHREFYEKLATCEALPTTSQATPAAFDRVFSQVAADGDSAVVLTLASALSGTYQSAMIAASEYENIHVVDSGSVAIGIGILTQRALELADEGLEAPEIARILTQEAQKIRIVAILDTLEYLKKGGRVSKTVAFAGALLNIKPIISVAEGQIGMLAKARGTKQGNKLMMSQIEAMGADLSRPVMLGFTGVSDEAMKTYLADSAAFWGDAAGDYTMIGSVIGTHAGPGAVAAAFFQK